jgi:hypothetical protein
MILVKNIGGKVGIKKKNWEGYNLKKGFFLELRKYQEVPIIPSLSRVRDGVTLVRIKK